MKLQEEKVTCSSCGSNVPLSIICVNCGNILSAIPEKMTEEVKDLLNRGHTEATGSEILGEMLTNLLDWRVKVIGLLDKGEITQETFIRIYQEYIKNALSLLESQTELDDKIKSTYLFLSKVDQERKKIRGMMDRAEISTEEYIREYSNLRTMETKAKDHLTRLSLLRERSG